MTNAEKWMLAVVLVLHAVGLVGIGWMQLPLLILATPINLVITAALVITASVSRHFLLVCLAVAAVGFGIEVLGVNTGWPFGGYAYGNALGPKLLGTPLVIGLNWLVLLLGSTAIAQRMALTTAVKVLVTASLMTLFDWVMEPVAIALGFWRWAGHYPPWQNYEAWFAISALMGWFVLTAKAPMRPQFSAAVFLVQALFFVLLRLLL